MAPPTDPREPVGRTPSQGPCFLYVAPCAYEDLLKLGFSRDPLERLRTLHPRFFEVFDLDRAMLVATETVRDARALELRLRRRLVEHNAPAPLVIRPGAGGATEWYRGAHARLVEAVAELETRGHTVHGPAHPWFREALRARGDLLYSWTLAMLSPDDLDGRADDPWRQRAVADALDAYDAFGIELEPLLPPAVLEWHRTGAHGRFG